MANEEELLTVIRGFLHKHLQVPPEEVTRESQLQDLEMDSLDSVTMIVEIENVLRKSIEAEILEECRTIGDLLDHCLHLQVATGS